MILDAAASRVRIHTFAEGLFSKLAHDLELVCGELSGRIEDETAIVHVPIEHIRVAGVLSRGHVDPTKLSSTDQLDILTKMRNEVFHASTGIVRISATRATIRVLAPGGDTFTTPCPSNGNIESTASRVAIRGSVDVPMSALGASVVKGPMGAFRVKDRVLVHFDVVFQPA